MATRLESAGSRPGFELRSRVSEGLTSLLWLKSISARRGLILCFGSQPPDNYVSLALI